MSSDFTELRNFADSLGTAYRRARPGMLKALNDTAKRIQVQARKNLRTHMSGNSTIRHLPNAIDFDRAKSEGDFMTTEVGANSSKKQGGMGIAVELGSSNAPPMPFLFPAANETEITRFIADFYAAIGTEIMRGTT